VCVATEIDFIFWGGVVILVGLGGFFGKFWAILVRSWSGPGLVLVSFGVVLWCVSFALYPCHVPVFFNIKLSVLKRLKVFKHT